MDYWSDGLGYRPISLSKSTDNPMLTPNLGLDSIIDDNICFKEDVQCWVRVISCAHQRNVLVLDVVVLSPSFSLRPYSSFDWDWMTTPVHISLKRACVVCHR